MPSRVSVLLPIFNCERYLPAAIDSLLSQSLSDYEVIAIDDGSEDNSTSILSAYAARDKRIRPFYQPNRGLPATLNRGLGLAQGEYVARMDADDISCPTRLERQVVFLDKNQQIGLCGTGVEAFGGADIRVWSYPTYHESIRCHHLFLPAFAHPTVMFRRSVLQATGGYSEEFPVAEDYELWLRLADVTQFANLPEPLLRLRHHASQKAAGEFRNGSMGTALRTLHARELNRMGIKPSPAELDIHGVISVDAPMSTRSFLLQAEGWLKKLVLTNSRSQYYPEPEFARTLVWRWWRTYSYASTLGIWTLRRFLGSHLRRLSLVRRTEVVRFAVACVWHHLHLERPGPL